MLPVAEKQPAGEKPRLLFCSWHSYLDPSNGAALCTRDLWELLASRGWECKTFCGPALDFDGTISQLIRDLGVPFMEKPGTEGSLNFSLFHYARSGVPVSIFDVPGRRASSSPPQANGRAFLSLCDKIFDQFKPDILLTYGGNWVVRAIMEAARKRKIRIAFALHNFSYDKAKDLFAMVDAVLVPSRFAQAHYREALGLQSTAIPGPWNWHNVRCSDFNRRFVTFVNPQPHKGVFVFVRITTELARLRPDIPFLVVEGRAGALGLEKTGHDLTGVANLHAMNNTPDPRDFYRVSRLVLMPSLWWESFPRTWPPNRSLMAYLCLVRIAGGSQKSCKGLASYSTFRHNTHRRLPSCPRPKRSHLGLKRSSGFGTTRLIMIRNVGAAMPQDCGTSIRSTRAAIRGVLPANSLSIFLLKKKSVPTFTRSPRFSTNLSCSLSLFFLTRDNNDEFSPLYCPRLFRI